MSRPRSDSQGSLGPDDEVMPYSDDETDEELEPSSEGDGPPGAPQEEEPKLGGEFRTWNPGPTFESRAGVNVVLPTTAC